MEIPAILEDSLGFSLHRLALLLRRELTKALADFDISPEQWQIVASLNTTNVAASQQDIAYLTLLDKHSVSRIVRRLEDNGWIQRSADKHDFRIQRVQLTNKGRKRFPLMQRRLKEHFAPIYNQLSTSESQTMKTHCNQLRSYLGDRAKGETHGNRSSNEN